MFRAKHLRRPDVLTPTELIEYTHKDPPIAGQREIFEGIEFGIERTLEIFWILSYVSPIDRLKVYLPYILNLISKLER
jgi:hypothetical protein